MAVPCVLVIGGTRGTGLLAVRALRRRGREVRVLARQPDVARAAVGPDVEVVRDDLIDAATLRPALQDVGGVIFTAGVRSGRLVPEARIKATDYMGVAHAIAAARDAGFTGRFVFMTSIGGVTPSIPAALLNALKGNVLIWRRRADEELRRSGLDYTIVRAGFFLNAAGGRRAVDVSQGSLPLSLRYRIARADVAEACVEALEQRRASRATFEIVWDRESRRDWTTLFADLRPDRDGRVRGGESGV